MKKHLKAYALPAVLVMSAVVLLMIFFAYDSLALKYRRYALYREAHQERENHTSALNLYLYDSLLCAAGDSADIFLFDGEDSVHVAVSDWGLYELVRLSNSSPDALTMLVGRRTECPAEAAFWICDRNRALSLSADARIEGLAYIPMNGLNYTEIASRYYSGLPLPESDLRLSGPDLPPLDSVAFRKASELCLLWRKKNKDMSLSDCLFGERVVLSENLQLPSDALVSARTVTVEKGFEGTAQIFASDTVIVEDGAVLRFPSGIFVNAVDDSHFSDDSYSSDDCHSGACRPFVRLGSDSDVSGYIAVFSENADSGLRFPSYIQEHGSTLRGLLCIDGSCELAGNVYGAAYIRDCYHRSGGNTFPGTLCDARFVRSDSLAFPILLSGAYTRKTIKKIY